MGVVCSRCTLENSTIYNLINQRLLGEDQLLKYCSNYVIMLQLIIRQWDNLKQSQPYLILDNANPQISCQNKNDTPYQQNAIIFTKNQFLYIGKIKNGKPENKGVLYQGQSAHNNKLIKYQGKFRQGLAQDTQAKTIIFNQMSIFAKEQKQVIFKKCLFSKGELQKCEMNIQNEAYEIQINKRCLKQNNQIINAKILFPDQQTIYEGEIVKTKQSFYKLEGKGKLTYPNKNQYIGTFENNKFQGQGKFCFANGKKYQGFYKNGLKHGKGKFYAKARTHPNNYLEAEWFNGSPIGQATSYPQKIKIIFQNSSAFSTIEQN